MTPDQWQAHVTREAAKAIGQWLTERGRLHQRIATLTMADLEAMAVNAIARFVVLGSERIQACPDDSEDLTQLLLGSPSAPCAGARRAALATCTSSAGTAFPTTASARCAASTPARRWQQGTME